jgi:4-amino-4-deoxy-L-arabinose transferase-like glycosyltransferase
MSPRLLLSIALLALAVRVPYVLLYPQIGSSCEDCRFYDEVARNIASGNGFVGGFASETFAGPVGHAAPEVGMGPVYPFFLAAVYRTAGRSAVAVAIVQALAGATTVVLATVIGFWFGRRVAIISGVLTALCPALIVYTGVMLTETLLALMLAVVVCLVGAVQRQPRITRAAMAGLALGVATLLRPECLLLLPLALIAIWWPGGGRRLAIALAVAIVACATIGVWTIRNYRVFHRPILVTAVGGEALWISTTGWDEWPTNDPELQALVAGLDYVGQNEVLGRVAMENIRRDPWQYAAYCLRRIPAFWITSHTTYVRGLSSTYRTYFDRSAYLRLGVKLTLLAISLASLALAAAGMWIAWLTHRRWAALIVLMPIVTIAGVHVFLYASPRYQVPILPELLVFAAVSLDFILARRVHGRHSGDRQLYPKW